MKYIIINSDNKVVIKREPDWTPIYTFDSLEEVKKFLMKSVHPERFTIFEVNKQIEVKLNEVPFKGLTSD